MTQNNSKQPKMTKNDTKKLSVTDGPTDRPTDRAGCRVACTRLKSGEMREGRMSVKNLDYEVSDSDIQVTKFHARVFLLAFSY